MTKKINYILIMVFMFITLFTLASCKNNNYRTFTFYNIQLVEGGMVSPSLIDEYDETTIDLYEDKLIYHNGLKTKTYKYEFNNGYLEVKDQKDATYQIKNDELHIKLLINNENVLLIYKVVK